MIEIGNRRWRNLQEQVAWLTAMIGQATDVVKNIYGTVADAASLPDASTFSNGTTYAVGAASPYEYYVAINGSWLDIGTFPLEGPAGTDGEDGKSIFITSQATTSGTTQILIASVYNPASLTIDAGDLILSEQGDIFAVTGSAAPAYYVVYRCNIKGPTGATGADGDPGAPGANGLDGINILTSSATTTSSTTAIQTSTINVPTGYTAKAGDMIVTSTGDVFVSTGPSSVPGYTGVTYCYNIKGDAGSPGAPGADGATWYEGSDMIYDSVGHTYDLSTTDAPGIAVGDLYLITTDYTSDGHDFTRGDIFTVSSISGTTCDCAFVCSILGPQGDTGATGADGADGAPGADGATWYSGTDVIHTGGSGGAYVIPLSSLPDLKVGDLYLVTSTYTSDGETLNNGDVWAVYSIADPYAVMTFRTNIVGAAGDNILFMCTYGTTTVAEIKAAVTAGKVPVFISGNKVYIYGGYTTTGVYFYNGYNWPDDVMSYAYVTSTHSYHTGTIKPEFQSNKVTSVSNTSNNVQYPSAKAVWDLAAPVIAPPSATLGQVWTADGNGGASFQNAGGGGGASIPGYSLSIGPSANSNNVIVVYLDNTLQPHRISNDDNQSVLATDVYKLVQIYLQPTNATRDTYVFCDDADGIMSTDISGTTYMPTADQQLPISSRVEYGPSEGILLKNTSIMFSEHTGGN